MAGAWPRGPILSRESLADSLSRAGVGVSGLDISIRSRRQRLELLKEAIPLGDRVAVLYDPDSQSNVLQLKGFFHPQRVR